MKEYLILTEGFQGDRNVMKLNDTKEEVYDFAVSEDMSGFEDYLKDNPNENIDDFAKFKASCLEDSVINGYYFEYHGMTYCVLDDEKIENLWDELEDVPFIENNKKELMLDKDWFIFSEKTEREDIWQWFDQHHTKGLGWLMNEYEKEINKDLETLSMQNDSEDEMEL